MLRVFFPVTVYFCGSAAAPPTGLEDVLHWIHWVSVEMILVDGECFVPVPSPCGLKLMRSLSCPVKVFLLCLKLLHKLLRQQLLLGLCMRYVELIEVGRAFGCTCVSECVLLLR